MNKLLIIVVLMCIVTFLPRLIPMIWLSNVKMPVFMKTFFRYLPISILSALVIPDIFYSCGTIKVSVIGAIVAVVLSIFSLNSGFVIAGTILSVYFISIF